MEIKAPHRVFNSEKPTLFLAGSIEMGTAEKWQDMVVSAIEAEAPNRFIILNPRRDDWDSSWKQEFEDPQFSQQVNWELKHLEQSDFAIFYFDPNTKSPITLMELGIVSQMGSKTTIVVCPEGFWRKGNVDIVCDKYGITQFNTLQEAVQEILDRTEYYEDDNDKGIDIKID